MIPARAARLPRAYPWGMTDPRPSPASRFARPPRALPVVLLGLVCAHAPSALAAPAQPSAAQVRDAARTWRRAHAREIVEELARLLAIPNVAGDPAGLERNVRILTVQLKKRGFDVRALSAGRGASAVVADLRAPGATRTLGIYAHYDGQPVDPARWTSPPFTPTLRDGPLERGGREVALAELAAAGAGDDADEWRLYARSASDDKAPIPALLAAIDALRAASLPLSVNLKLLLDGEEESGSPNLETLMSARPDALAADLWLLCDGPVHPSRRMQLFFGARGVLGLELTLYGPRRALHSGHYGNWVPNPGADLATLVASMRDRDGRVTIAGFGDDVRPASAAERRALEAVPDVDAELRAELLLAPAEAGRARLAESVLQPALNLRGIEAGQVGEQATNAIPTQARASIDFRLVPDQTPAGVIAAVEAHLARQGFHVVRDEPTPELRRAHARVLRAQWSAGYPAARTDMELPLARDLRRVVDEAVGGTLVLVPTLGGSIPMHLFPRVLRAPVVGVPIANHDNNQHAADENLRLRNLWDAIELYAALLARLGGEPEAR